MRLRLNGEDRQLKPGTSLSELLADLAVDPSTTFVVRNGEVVTRDRLGDAVLAEGDELELFRVVGGG